MRGLNGFIRCGLGEFAADGGRRSIWVIDVLSAAAPMLTLRVLAILPANQPDGGRMPKVRGQSALDKERAKTDKLLKKVGYTALKEAGVKSRRPDLPNLKTEKREK
ncbi:hypothetical protein SLT36_02265 [Aminobacter sp. BA135]|uniref:hypothetical protein n=1 Tax=Aminobacter sp. BA135 TaxID=537596 RepID=UPI003D7ABFBC